MPSKKQRQALTAQVASRFPKGSAKGDTLAGVNSLGNSYRSVNSLSFSSTKKRESLKLFSIK